MFIKAAVSILYLTAHTLCRSSASGMQEFSDLNSTTLTHDSNKHTCVLLI